MFANKSAVLAQINSVIQNNAFTQKEHDYLRVHKQGESETECNQKPFYRHTNNREVLKKLQQRVESLEEHSDHLLYFIHFLFQNFSELVKNILSTDSPKEEALFNKATEPPCKTQKAGSNFKKEKMSLTKREMDVFNLLIKGLCAKEIANKLFISETTVITHKKHLKEKFNAKNTAEFISKATTVSLQDNSDLP